MAKSFLYHSAKKIAVACLSLPIIALSAQAVLANPRTNSNSHNFKLHNSSRFKIKAVYVSHVNKDDWGENMLENEALWQDESMNLNFEDESNSCTFDMKVVGEDNHEETMHNVNLCDNREYEIDDE
jgi:hypothetical protein